MPWAFGQCLRVWGKGRFGPHQYLRLTSFMVIQRAWRGEIYITVRQNPAFNYNCATELEETSRINAGGGNLAK